MVTMAVIFTIGISPEKKTVAQESPLSAGRYMEPPCVPANRSVPMQSIEVSPLEARLFLSQVIPLSSKVVPFFPVSEDIYTPLCVAAKRKVSRIAISLISGFQVSP
jgi:hypothetical protein